MPVNNVQSDAILASTVSSQPRPAVQMQTLNLMQLDNVHVLLILFKDLK